MLASLRHLIHRYRGPPSPTGEGLEAMLAQTLQSSLGPPSPTGEGLEAMFAQILQSSLCHISSAYINKIPASRLFRSVGICILMFIRRG